MVGQISADPNPAPGTAPAAHDEFRLIADAAPVPMWVTALDRRRSFVNTAYVSFVGGGFDAALARDWRDIIHPDDVQRILAESIAGEATLASFTLEGRFRRADGQWRVLQSTSQPRWDAGGRHIGYVGVAHDVTEARQAAADLGEREARYAAVVDQSAAGLAQVDPIGRFTLVNDRFCALTGRSREELLATTMQAVTYPDDLPRNLLLFERIVTDGTPYVLEKRFLRPDGSTVWVSNSVSLIRRKGGEPAGVLAVAIDVTERRAAEAALRHREESLRLAIEGAGMAAWEMDIGLGVGRWSPNRFDLLGLPRSEGGEGSVEDWLARVHAADVAAVEAAWRSCVQDGTPYTVAYRIRRADSGEERWLQSHGSRVDEDGRPSRFVGVSFDVTDNRRAQHRQQLLIDELNHRVKNTLAIVQGIAQQTFRAGIDPDVARQAFEGRLRALSAAHDLLTVQHWDDVSLARVVAQAVAPHDGRGAITLRGPDLPIAPRTAVSLALAIHELATNAIKYGALSVPDGRVDIRWSREIAEGGERLALAWTEREGPPVAEPERRGFGTRMIERGLSAELGGTVRIDFATAGVRCTVDAPLTGSAA